MTARLLVTHWRMVGSSIPLLLIPALLAGLIREGLLRSNRGQESLAPATRGPARPERSSLPAAAIGDRPGWPGERLEGEPAKRLLLSFLATAADRLERVGSYTAVLLKRERLNGTLAAEETMEIKVRHQPFSVYLKYRGRKEGREVIYADGKNENKLIAHAGDWTSRLVPRLSLEPTGTLAMVDNRHPITEIGLAHLTGQLLAACRRDLKDPDVSTALDRFVEEGRAWLRSVQVYPRRTPERPLARVEVCYDPESGLPLRFSGDEWPEPGEAEDRRLGESYRYDKLRLDTGLSDQDFDPDNPAYAFVRF